MLKCINSFYLYVIISTYIFMNCYLAFLLSPPTSYTSLYLTLVMRVWGKCTIGFLYMIIFHFGYAVWVHRLDTSLSYVVSWVVHTPVPNVKGLPSDKLLTSSEQASTIILLHHPCGVIFPTKPSSHLQSFGVFIL